MSTLDVILLIIGDILIIIGAVFMLVAAFSLLRMPDLYLRMSASTKAATLGVGLVLLGAAAQFATTEPATAIRAGAVIIFIFLTAPISAHMIARAAYFSGNKMWEGTLVDEWQHDRSQQALKEAGEPTVD